MKVRNLIMMRIGVILIPSVIICASWNDPVTTTATVNPETGSCVITDYAEMDKPGGNKVHYHSGAIENPDINQHIVDVLEGTRPAFDDRDAKYKIIPD